MFGRLFDERFRSAAVGVNAYAPFRVMLGSAVCGQISTEELSYAANLIQSRNFRAFEAFIVATAVYLLLSIATRATLNWFGQRFLFGGRRG